MQREEGMEGFLILVIDCPVLGIHSIVGSGSPILTASQETSPRHTIETPLE